MRHTNSKSEVRGFQSKLDIFYFKLRLFRENGKPDDLESPFTVEYEEMRGSMGSRQRVPFQVQYSNADRRWQVFQPERTENEELKLIVDDFKRCGYSRSAICNMIGLKKSALSERIKSN